ncbi:MAG: lysostaphin resistance A-like protein [Candidatus Acidiferrales bacterium]
MRWQSIPPAVLGLHFWNQWAINLAIGISAGLIRVVILTFSLALFPRRPYSASADRVRRGSVRLWLTNFFAGALVEEFWIAFCLVTFRGAGHSLALALTLTACVFGALHFEHRPEMLRKAILGAISGSLFLWRGSLLPPFIFHFVGNLGYLYWFRLARRSAGARDPNDLSLFHSRKP